MSAMHNHDRKHDEAEEVSQIRQAEADSEREVFCAASGADELSKIGQV